MRSSWPRRPFRAVIAGPSVQRTSRAIFGSGRAEATPGRWAAPPNPLRRGNSPRNRAESRLTSPDWFPLIPAAGLWDKPWDAHSERLGTEGTVWCDLLHDAPELCKVKTSDAEPVRVRLGTMIRGSSVRVRPPLSVFERLSSARVPRVGAQRDSALGPYVQVERRLRAAHPSRGGARAANRQLAAAARHEGQLYTSRHRRPMGATGRLLRTCRWSAAPPVSGRPRSGERILITRWLASHRDAFGSVTGPE